ncbi:serine hydrolase domain-containing protein [Ascidiimonas sp. W6]|uniref:serine hydrolase domain-containing protein n=1 Tax=Ascidiimonas meishanensis TaxID=3128903 RepID=UPI0030ECFDD0
MKEINQIHFLLLLLSFFLFACQNQSEKQNIKTLFGTNISEEKVGKFIDKEMESLNISALSIAIINEGKVVYHQVKGFADKEKQILADDNSIFEGASISKSVFGFFAMTFVEDGILNLDKPLYEYLPNPDIDNDERYKKITARIVLSHRSGFPNWRTDYPDKKLFIQFEPGTDYHYSGEGYQYLAEVLKHLLNTNWAGLEEEFQKRVAIPFKMEHTKFIQDYYIKKHKVQPYDIKGIWIDKYASDIWRSYDSIFVAPTTIHSEAVDFSKWMIAMMNEKGLSENGFKELYKPHSEIASGLLRQDYTLGFIKLSILNISELFTHSGNNDGFSTYFALDKDKKWGFVVFTNSSRLGDQFAQNLTYNLLLSGTIGKQIAIGLVLVFAILLLITNLIFVLFKKSPLYKIKKINFRIGLIAFFCSTSSLILMLTINYRIAKYLYLLAMLTVLLLGFKTLRMIVKYWREENNKKIDLVFQAVFLLGVMISGIAVGILQ